MFGLTRIQIGHTMMALGTGLAIFLGEASRITTNPWADAACYGAVATLAALGVGVAKRASSSSDSEPTPPSA